MLVVFLDKMNSGKFISMCVGTNREPFYEIFESDDHLYELYADFINDVLDKAKFSNLFICHPQVKKLFSFTGFTYEIRNSQNLEDDVLIRVRKKIESLNISVIYDRILASKFRSFLTKDL